VSLLLRFWEYREGEILLGGRDLRDWRQEAVRQRLAVVSQRVHLFNASVRENLLLADPRVSEAGLIQAAQAAQIHDRILSLPQGYDTWIGEGGLRLSGGERRRLVIARALLQDAPVLILDEPAAHLDRLTGQKILETILTQAGGRSILLITHNLAGLERMDEILVLLTGRLVERGTHADLIERGGIYARMWALQTGLIREDDVGANGH
jgi:ATP-binding cassette subfamily C protein CydC